MRHAWIVMAVLGSAATAAADPRPWSIDVPAGWTEARDDLAPQLEAMRTKMSFQDVTGIRYRSPDGAVTLTLISWKLHFDAPTRSTLEEVDLGTVKGFAKKATKHISDERHFVGDQLDADQLDDIGPTRVHQHRRLGLDSADLVHSVSGLCGGPADALADCDRALSTLALHIADPVAPSEDLAAKSTEYQIGYRIGRAAGPVLLALLVVFVVVWLSKRKQKPRDRA